MNHKCKMCGGVLTPVGKEKIITCAYCGTKQTIPCPDSERIAGLYEKADGYRRNLEFDKALALYEEILNEDSTDAECYWLALLCEFGIEYVEETAGAKRIPTINRMQPVSIFNNANYKGALKYADAEQTAIYKAEAEEINRIQKGILEISRKEEPFDIFICYKETDENGRRTLDSVLTTDIYELLTKEGYKVFFSRITLDDKIGVAYEPYIYAALQSSKIMIVVGTKPEHFNAVWVRNEWSRYLYLIKSGAKKVLITAYNDKDPYELPEEFKHLQAINLGELGCHQDLVRGIRKIFGPVRNIPHNTNEIKKTPSKYKPIHSVPKKTEPVKSQKKETDKDSEIQRVILLLEEKKWEEAEKKATRMANKKPRDIQAQTAKLMAAMRISGAGDYRAWAMRPPEKPILTILESGSQEDVRALKRLLEAELPENPEKLYQEYKKKYENIKTSEVMKQCATVFKSLREYKDSRKLWSLSKDAAIDIERQETEELQRIRAICATSKVSDIKMALEIAQESSLPLVRNEGRKFCENRLSQVDTINKVESAASMWISISVVCAIIFGVILALIFAN